MQFSIIMSCTWGFDKKKTAICEARFSKCLVDNETNIDSIRRGKVSRGFGQTRAEMCRAFFSRPSARKRDDAEERFRSLRTINVRSSVKSESRRQSGSQAKLLSTPLACTPDGTSSGAGEGPPVVSRIASFRSVIPNARFLSWKRSRCLQPRRSFLRDDREISSGSRAFCVPFRCALNASGETPRISTCRAR